MQLMVVGTRVGFVLLLWRLWSWLGIWSCHVESTGMETVQGSGYTLQGEGRPKTFIKTAKEGKEEARERALVGQDSLGTSQRGHHDTLSWLRFIIKN